MACMVLMAFRAVAGNGALLLGFRTGYSKIGRLHSKNAAVHLRHTVLHKCPAQGSLFFFISPCSQIYPPTHSWLHPLILLHCEQERQNFATLQEDFRYNLKLIEVWSSQSAANSLHCRFTLIQCHRNDCLVVSGPSP